MKIKSGTIANPAVKGSEYRWAMYGILSLLIIANILLSIWVNQTSNSVRVKVKPLLEEKIPSLMGLSDFESAILRYQLALNKYFANSVSRDRFLVIEGEAKTEMDQTFNFVLNALEKPEELNLIQESYATILEFAPRLDKELSRQNIDADEVRSILLDLNARIITIRTALDRVQKKLSNSSMDSAEEIMHDIAVASQFVHIYTVASLLIAIFLIYQFRARLLSEQRLAFQAWHDPLTELPHRLAFEYRLKMLGDEPHVIILGVADRLEQIVAGFGHHLADQLILEITARIQEVAKLHDGEVFRLDGANLAVLYKFSNTDVAFDAAIDTLRQINTIPIQLDGQEIHITLSLGASEYPVHGVDPIQLLKNADAALTAARELGGDTYVFYSHVLNERSAEKLALEAALGHALELNELELHYQPQLDIADSRLIGFEALVRWRRNGQLISPADFIPLAESSGLIIPIGNWIFDEACRKAKLWNEGREEKLVVAINISPRQFSHPGFMQMVMNSVGKIGIDPRLIELEITEGVMMQEPERTALVLKQLRSLGFKLSIDDFGTGYSSLAYLQRFSITKLKIDQSFIRKLTEGSGDAAIVQAVITLGHNLGIHVIAEGVETEAQLELLSAWRCDEVQGYLYSKPLQVEDATNFIGQQDALIHGRHGPLSEQYNSILT